MREFGERLQSIDKRFVYAVMAFALVMPLVRPLGFPVNVTRETRAAYDLLESLPSGSIVLLATSIFPSTQAELEPQTIAILHHLVKKHIKVAIAPCYPDTPAYVARYVDLLKTQGYKDGVDYVSLPYMSGEETLYGAMGKDFKKTYAQVPSSQLWDSISSVKSFEAVIVANGGQHPLYAVAHIGAPNNVKVIASITAVVLSSVQQYFNSGQVSGIVAGMNGAAEYEHLVGVPGQATAGMDAQSLGHLWIIALAVLGNIGYLTARFSKKQTGGV